MASVNYVKDDAAQTGTVPGKTSSNTKVPSIVDELWYNDSGSAISVGDWVTIDPSSSVEPARSMQQAATSSTSAQTLGVCIGIPNADGSNSDVPDDDWGFVRRAGIVYVTDDGFHTNVDSGVAAGPLRISTANAGAAQAGTEGTHGIVGYNYVAADGDGSDRVLVKCL